MKLGFATEIITPPVGTELGGYAGYRPCSGVHDDLLCKAVVLEQEDGVYALVALDLMCVDEPLYVAIGERLAPLGIPREKLIVSAIHSHAAPQGTIPGAGVLAKVNTSNLVDPDFGSYMETVISAAERACREAFENREPFRVRIASGPQPPIGSERHTGESPGGSLFVLQFLTRSGRKLTVYNFACHPTVLNAGNLAVSADFVGGIQEQLDCHLAIFLNGAAGDISTRFTRKESSFAECRRMGEKAARAISEALEGKPFREPTALKGSFEKVVLQIRDVEPEETARKKLAELTEVWQAAEAAGEPADRVRILRSYAEGAWVSLEFARSLEGITRIEVPVTAFTFCNTEFITVPGELFSSLLPDRPLAVIAYANGYCRYFTPRAAYEAGYYESMAALVKSGESEKLVDVLLRQLDKLK